MKRDVRITHIDGLTVITSRVPGAKMTDMNIHVRVGSLDEHPKHKRGVAHFFEHLPFRGTKNFPAHSPDAEVATENGYLNAHTSFTETVYKVTYPSKTWSRGLSRLTDLVCNPLLREEDIRSETETIVNEEYYKQGDQDGHDLYEIFHTAYDDKIITPIIGRSVQEIRSITGDDLRRFYNENYTRERCIICVEGNIDHDAVVAQIKRDFTLPKGNAPRNIPVIAYKGGYAVIPNKHRKDSIGVELSLPLDIKNMDQRQRLALLVLQQYLYGSNGLLMNKLRRERPLVYGINGLINNPNDAFGLHTTVFSASPENTKLCLNVFAETLKDICSGQIDKSQFDVIKQQASFALSVMASKQRELGVSTMTNNYLSYGRVITPEETVRLLNNIQMDDLVEVAQLVFTSPPTLIMRTDSKDVMSKQEFEQTFAPLAQLKGTRPKVARPGKGTKPAVPEAA